MSGHSGFNTSAPAIPRPLIRQKSMARLVAVFMHIHAALRLLGHRPSRSIHSHEEPTVPSRADLSPSNGVCLAEQPQSPAVPCRTGQERCAVCSFSLPFRACDAIGAGRSCVHTYMELFHLCRQPRASGPACTVQSAHGVTRRVERAIPLRVCTPHLDVSFFLSLAPSLFLAHPISPRYTAPAISIARAD